MKHLLYLLVVVVAVQACRRDNTDNAVTKDNKLVAEHLFDAYNRHDWDSVATFYTDTSAFMNAQSNNVFFHKSKSVLIGELKAIEQNIPNIHADIQEVYIDRNTTIIEYTLKGHTAEGIILQHYCLVWTIKNQKVIREVKYILQ